MQAVAEKGIRFVDGETFRIWLGALTATSLTLAQINTGLTTFILIGTAIYTWRRVLRRRKK